MCATISHCPVCTWQRTYIKHPKFFIWWIILKKHCMHILNAILLMGSSWMIVIILLIILSYAGNHKYWGCAALLKKYYHVKSLHIHNHLQLLWLLHSRDLVQYCLLLWYLFTQYLLAIFTFTTFLLFLGYKQLKVQKLCNLLISFLMGILIFLEGKFKHPKKWLFLRWIVIF